MPQSGRSVDDGGRLTAEASPFHVSEHLLHPFAMRAFELEWARWPLLFAGWTALALSFAVQFYVSSGQAGYPVTWSQAAGGSLGDWYVVGALSWPVARMARRFEWERGHGIECFLAHALGAAAFSVAFVFLRALVGMWQGWAAGQPVSYRALVEALAIKTWHLNLIIYGVIVAATQAVRYYRESQQRALRALELEHGLAEARLMALQMQINPHFLFNALNSIATLIHRNPNAADDMVVRLGQLLRLTLGRSTEQEVSLGSELEILERYLDIERVRFGDRFRFELSAGPEELRAKVPNLLLQPIVENSLKHGLSGASRDARIEVAARRSGDFLTLTVRDHGPGLSPANTRREGIGLANTLSRLEHLYGTSHEFELVNHPDGGTLCRISIPFQTAEPRREKDMK